MQTFSVEKPAGLLTYRLRNRRLTTLGNSPVVWERLKDAVSSDQWEWDALYRKQYEHYLRRHDCPAWLREAFERPIVNSEASTGD